MKLNFENRSRLTQAIAFTTHIHGAPGHSTGMLARLTHCLETADIVSVLTPDMDTRVAAVLHDIPEYFPTKVPLIERCFGSEVAQLALLEPYPEHLDAISDNWQRRKLYVINHLVHADYSRKALFLADKLSEMRYLSTMGYTAPKARKNPSLLAWYYRSVLLALNELSRTEPYSELQSRIKLLCDFAEAEDR